MRNLHATSGQTTRLPIQSLMPEETFGSTGAEQRDSRTVNAPLNTNESHLLTIRSMPSSGAVSSVILPMRAPTDRSPDVADVDQAAQPLSVLPQAPRHGLNSADESVRRTTRFRLWELQACWHCMIIGTCLTLREVRQQAKKAGFAVDALSDYEIHRLAVERAAGSRHQLTQRIQKLLDRKYDVQLRRFRPAVDSDALAACWQSAREVGQVGGGLWALLTHPRSTSDLIHVVFGEVHMMSHLAGAKSCVDLERLTTQDTRIDELEAEVAEVRHRHLQATQAHVLQRQRFDRELKQLQREVAVERAGRRKAECAAASLPLAADDTDTPRTIERLHRDNAALAQRTRALEADLRQLGDENTRLDRQLSQLLASAQQQGEADEHALCGQCVLYLGGKAQQCRHFQALVEARSGRFLHHDGGIEDNGQRISDLVHRADAVLCPTDCISHSAMKKARLLCEKQHKPLIFMQRASLSAFASSLEQVAFRARAPSG